MATGIVRDQSLEKHIEKQMGCMAGFLQIFDRHQILTGKRIYSAKRLPPSPSAPSASDSSPETEKHGGSPVISTPSPDFVRKSPAREAQPPPSPSQEPKAAVTVPFLEFKEGTRPWKFSREAPRLSLDSRTNAREIRTNAAAMLSTNLENDVEKQRRSTSVVARLMGLEPLPDSDPEPEKKAELRRSVSESRVSKDLPSQYRFFDANNFQLKPNANVVREYNAAPSAIDKCLTNGREADPAEFVSRNVKAEIANTKAPARVRHRGIIGQKKSFYDSADFFPEPKHTVSIYGEIEKRLKMRGIDEPSKDLETLKHILDALQLKGLLHSNKPSPQTTHTNFIRNDSPIVVIKPARSSGFLNRTGRTGIDSPPSGIRSSPRARRNLSPNLTNEARSVRNQDRARNLSLNSCGTKSPNRRKVPNLEPQRKVNNDGVDSRRVSTVHSPRINSRRNAANQHVTNGSPRMRTSRDQKEKMLGVSVAEDQSSSTVSESSFSTSSHTDTERYKLEEYKEGRNLLDRCDKLLNSIAEITASTELQPSPVSVLDPSFYRDEWSSPSPITKRCIDYKDQAAESEDDMWSAALTLCSRCEAKSEDASEDSDSAYVSEILRACSYLPEDSDVFLLLEKQQSLKGKDTSKASTLQRRLIFDTVSEILNRNQQLPPWKAVSHGEQTHRIWWEFRRIREREESEDLFEVICGVLKKDMAMEEMNGWGEWPLEMGDVVLDIERLVFKDLIGETIRELTSVASQCNRVSALRRKLIF